MENNNYRAKWSEEDNCYLCKSLDYPSIITHGETIQEAIKELETLCEVLKKDKDSDI